VLKDREVGLEVIGDEFSFFNLAKILGLEDPLRSRRCSKKKLFTRSIIRAPPPLVLWTDASWFFGCKEGTNPN
jgi:hypothetical protein